MRPLRATVVGCGTAGAADVLPATCLDVRMPRWHAGRTVLLGDGGQGPLGRVGFVRRPMLQTLVGVNTGVWRSMEVPP